MMIARYITLMAAAMAMSAVAQELIITAPGEIVDFEGNKGRLPSTVTARERTGDIDRITFGERTMTIHKAADETTYDVADVARVSLSGRLNTPVGYTPPSVARRLAFETMGNPGLDLDIEAVRATDQFAAVATEPVDAAAGGTIVLEPAVATLYRVSGTGEGTSIAVGGTAECMLLLDNAAVGAIEIDTAKDVYVATAPGSVNTAAWIHHSGSGALRLSGEGALGITVTAESTAAIRASGNIVISGGVINIHTGGYGSQGIYADGDLTVNRAALNIVTTGGGTQEDDSLGFDAAAAMCAGVKGAKSGGNVSIDGARIRIKTTGGTGAIGIGAMHKMRIDNTELTVATFDDPLNAVDEIQTNNSTVFTTSEVDDGMDSNGALIFRGGKMYVAGPYPKESAFDNDGKNFALESGATLVAVGAKSDAPWDYKSTVPYLRAKTIETKRYVIIRSTAGADVLAFMVPEYLTGEYSLIVAAPGIAKQTEYEVYTTDSCVRAVEHNGFLTDALWDETPQRVATLTSSTTK